MRHAARQKTLCRRAQPGRASCDGRRWASLAPLAQVSLRMRDSVRAPIRRPCPACILHAYIFCAQGCTPTCRPREARAPSSEAQLSPAGPGSALRAPATKRALRASRVPCARARAATHMPFVLKTSVIGYSPPATSW